MKATLTKFMITPVGSSQWCFAVGLADLLNSLTDLAAFSKIFQKLDTEKIGLIKAEEFFKHIECQRSIYTDALLFILDIDVGNPLQGVWSWTNRNALNMELWAGDLELNFNDFFRIVVHYCFFETMEILKCEDILSQFHSCWQLFLAKFAWQFSTRKRLDILWANQNSAFPSRFEAFVFCCQW